MTLAPALAPPIAPDISVAMFGGSGAGGSLVVPPIGGVQPLVLWDARTGITQSGGVVSAWKDQIRGEVLGDNGPTTGPGYGADGAFFGGQPVVQFDGVNDTLLNATAFSPAITPAAARSYWFCVFRYRTAGNGVLFAATDIPQTTFMPELNRATTLQGLSGATTINAANPQSDVHVCEFFINATTGVITTSLDGADVTGGSGWSMPAAVTRVTLGNYLAANFAPVSIAAVGCYATELTSAQRRALRNYYALTWLYPPSAATPADFLSNLLVWIDPSPGYVTTSIGKISAFTNRGSLGGTIAQATSGLRSTLTAADTRFASKPSFNGSANNLRYPLPVLGSPAAAECFVVGVHAADPPAALAQTGFQQIGGATSVNDVGHIPLDNRVVYGEFASNARKTLGTWPGNFAAPWLIDLWSAPNDWGMRINRAAAFASASNVVSTAVAPLILYDNRSTGFCFVGSWAAYFLCGSKQSPAQRAQLETWVLATYGV